MQVSPVRQEKCAQRLLADINAPVRIRQPMAITAPRVGHHIFNNRVNRVIEIRLLSLAEYNYFSLYVSLKRYIER